MGVPREDLLLMTRALKRGLADVKAIRRALDRQVSKPISFLEALHLPPGEAQALKADASTPEPLQDRPLLESLHAMLVEGEHLTPAEWEKFVASLSRPIQKAGYAPLAVPQEFDGYSLQWELARRERGVVFRARDREGHDLAIKVFRKDVPTSGDLPKVEGHAYAVMPFADGESLEARRPATPRRSVQVIESAAHLLRSAPHGALTPARILVRKNDAVVVIGFEHARAVPLSARGQAYAGKDDVRALGAILYELLTGSPPAGEESPAARSHDVDADLDRIVSCALRGGYGSTSEFYEDLGRYLRGEPVTARRAAAAAAAAAKKKPWGLVAAAALVLAGIATAAVVFATKGKAPEAKLAPPPEGPAPVVQKSAPPPEVPKPKPPPKPENPKSAVAPKPLTPEDDEALYKAGMQAIDAGDWERVIATGNEAASRGSRKDWAYHLATAYTERDELDKALEYATRAFEAAAEANKKIALEKRAEVYVLRGEVGKAMADLEALHAKKAKEYNHQILRLNDQIKAGGERTDARTYLQRGVYFALKKDFGAAAEDFTAAVKLGRTSALVWRAFARRGQGDPSRAIEDLRAYRAAAPSGYATDEATALLRELGAN